MGFHFLLWVIPERKQDNLNRHLWKEQLKAGNDMEVKLTRSGIRWSLCSGAGWSLCSDLGRHFDRFLQQFLYYLKSCFLF
jgi:hypothetical protein